MNTTEMMRPVIERLQSSANVQTVFGDPFESHGKTYVPVATVAYGFGGGSGMGQRAAGEGGLGGGVRIRPAGVLEITAEGTRYIQFEPSWRTLTAVGFLVLIGLRTAVRLSRQKR